VGRPDFLRFREKERFLEAVEDPFFQTLFLLYAEAGPRPVEGLGMKPSDVLFQRRELRIERNRTKYGALAEQPSLEPGRRPRFLAGLTTTKNGTSRTVPLSRRLEKAMRANLDFSAEFLFPTSYQTMMRRFSEAVAKAGLGREMSPYILRHTFASLLGIRGISGEYIAEWLGHADWSTTRVYTHMTPEPDDTIAPLTGRETMAEVLDVAFSPWVAHGKDMATWLEDKP
jgi:integrase/recombinase XerD